MELEERIAHLTQELSQCESRMESLKRKIDFSREWSSDLQARLVNVTEGRVGDRITNQLWEELHLELEGLASMEEELATTEERIKRIRIKLWQEESRIFEFGWRRTEIGANDGRVRVPTGSELDALKVIAESDGACTIGTVCKRLGASLSYAKTLCLSLGRADYIDILPDGTCRLTGKGERAAEKCGIRS